MKTFKEYLNEDNQDILVIKKGDWILQDSSGIESPGISYVVGIFAGRIYTIQHVDDKFLSIWYNTGTPINFTSSYKLSNMKLTDKDLEKYDYDSQDIVNIKNHGIELWDNFQKFLKENKVEILDIPTKNKKIEEFKNLLLFDIYLNGNTEITKKNLNLELIRYNTIFWNQIKNK